MTKDLSNMEQLTDSSENASEERKSRRNWYLYFCVIAADLLLLCNGFMLVWTSSVVPKLRSNSTDINPYGKPISTMEESILASINIIFCPLASITMTNLPAWVGRKGAMAIFAATMSAALIAVACSTNIIVLILAVIVIGFCRGTIFTVIVQYNKELAQNNNRGRLGIIIAVVNPLGNVYGFAVGPFTSVPIFTLLCIVPILLHIICHAFIPETPKYLISKGRRNEAIKVLEKLNPDCRAAEIEKTYEVMKNDFQEQSNLWKDILIIFKSPTSRKAMFICCMAVLIQESSGMTAFLGFAAPMFNDVKTGLSGDSVAILLGVVKVFSALLACYTVEKLGRRCLLLFSSIACAVVLFTFGLYLYLQHHHTHIIKNLTWLPILCVIAFFVLYATGIGSVGYALLNDFFPVTMIGSAFACYAAVLGLMMSIQLFAFPLISKYLGPYYCMWFYSGGCFFGFLFYYFCLFETKGKSQEEIKILLSK